MAHGSLASLDCPQPHEDKEDLDQLVSQINGLQASHNELVRVMRGLQVRAARIQNGRTPVARLPSDVLVLIFAACRQINVQWSGVLSLLRQSPIEIRLSHVCTHWRAVALSSPSLWSRIHYPFEHGEASLREYVRRSEGSALRVYLGPWAKTPNPNLERVLASVLLPHVARFEELVLDAVSRETLGSLLALFRDVAVPELRRCRVMCRGHMPTHGGPLPIVHVFTKGAPRLIDVRLDNLPVLLPSSAGAVVETLTFSVYPGPQLPMSRHAFHHIVGACPGLHTLHLRGFIELVAQSPTSPVHLPHLRELAVNGRVLSNGLRLFDLISAPHIETFILEDVKAPALAAIHKVIARSHPHGFQSLTRLRYVRCEFGAELDVHLLRATPNVRELVLSVDKHMPLVRLLVNSDKQAAMYGSPPMWAALQRVTLHTQGYGGPGHAQAEAPTVVAVGVPMNEPSATMTLLQEWIACRTALDVPLTRLRFQGPNATTFSNEFAWVMQTQQAKQDVHVHTEAVCCALSGMADCGYATDDWAAVAEGYSNQLRQFLAQVSLVRHQIAPVLPPNFNIQHLRRRGVST